MLIQCFAYTVTEQEGYRAIQCMCANFVRQFHSTLIPEDVGTAAAKFYQRCANNF